MTPDAKSRNELARNLRNYLEKLGFKKTKYALVSFGADFVDVVELQQSKWDGKITLNLGVFNRELFDIVQNSIVHDLRTRDCVVETRLGLLKSGGRTDEWWDPSSISAYQSVVTDFQQYAVPFFAKHHSWATLVEYLTSNGVTAATGFPESYYLAALYFKMSRKKEACELMNQLLSNAVAIGGTNTPIYERAKALHRELCS